MGRRMDTSRSQVGVRILFLEKRFLREQKNIYSSNKVFKRILRYESIKRY